MMPKRLTRLLTLLPSLLFVASPIFSQSTPAPAVSPFQQGERTRMLHSKLKLLADMLQSSATAKRLEASVVDDEVDALLSRANFSHWKAREQLQQGELDAAEQRLDDGLKAFGMAARKVIDVEREQQIEKDRFQELVNRSKGFIEALARAVSENGRTVSTQFDEIHFKQQMSTAKSLARHKRFGDANHHLEPALATLEQALSTARHQQTLTNTLNFDSPSEELAYERERNQSHLLLISLMMSERVISNEHLEMIDEIRERNRQLVDRAVLLDAQGDTESAIDSLERGTGELVRALRLTGLSF